MTLGTLTLGLRAHLSRELQPVLHQELAFPQLWIGIRLLIPTEPRGKREDRAEPVPGAGASPAGPAGKQTPEGGPYTRSLAGFE